MLSVGGFISNLDKKSMKLLVLTNGLITDRGKNISNKQDAQRACGLLGIKDIIFLNYKDQDLILYLSLKLQIN